MEQNKGKERLTTVQAGLLLNLVYGVDGLDTIGWQCTARSIEMARRIGLFEAGAHEADDPKIAHARVYTAWSAFCWQRYGILDDINPPTVQALHAKTRLQSLVLPLLHSATRTASTCKPAA